MPDPREPRAHRVLRRLEHPGRGDRRLDGRVPRRRPKNAHYRTFAIRGVRDGPDDVGAMREVISRRFARRARREPDESFSRTPNLVVVDGGRGQLAAALAAMEELDLPRVAVIALAKREEEVFVPGSAEPIRLDRAGPALQLLQRARDEAHRVALRYHRRRRGARAMETIFETLTASVRRGGGPSSGTSAWSSASSTRRAGGARGGPRTPAEDRRALYGQLHKAGLPRPASGLPDARIAFE